MKVVTNTKVSDSRIKIHPKIFDHTTKINFYRKNNSLDKSFVMNIYQSETTGRYPNMLGHVYLNGNRCYVVNCFRVTGGYSSYTRFLIELNPNIMAHQIDARTVTGTINYEDLAKYVEIHSDKFFVYQDANVYYIDDPQRVSCASMWTAADDAAQGWIFRSDISYLDRQLSDKNIMSAQFCNYLISDSIEVRLCEGRYYGGYINPVHISIDRQDFNSYRLPLAPNRLSINL